MSVGLFVAGDLVGLAGLYREKGGQHPPSRHWSTWSIVRAAHRGHGGIDRILAAVEAAGARHGAGADRTALSPLDNAACHRRLCARRLCRRGDAAAGAADPGRVSGRISDGPASLTAEVRPPGPCLGLPAGRCGRGQAGRSARLRRGRRPRYVGREEVRRCRSHAVHHRCRFRAALCRAAGRQARGQPGCRCHGGGDHRRCAGPRRCGGDRADRAVRPAGPDAGDAGLSAEPRSRPHAPGSRPTTARRWTWPPTRIRAYHARQMPQDARWTEPTGAMLGWRWTPVAAAGLYVPGGLASYPSSVLMNAIPAKVAGVGAAGDRRADAGRRGEPAGAAGRRGSPGSTRSTASAAPRRSRRWPRAPRPSRPVDKITGPGNAYVAAAKRRVFGRVGIDMIAGPSEILVIADADNDPDWIALDLLSQAEHDASAQAILITDDAGFRPARWRRRWRGGCETLDRRAIAGASWRDFGAVITVRDLDEAARAGRPHRARASGNLHRRPRGAGGAGSAMPGRSFWAPGRPRRSATTSAGRTMCCRRRARRGSRRACRCWISSSAPRSAG